MIYFHQFQNPGLIVDIAGGVLPAPRRAHLAPALTGTAQTSPP
jgi:hypothetical protein